MESELVLMPVERDHLSFSALTRFRECEEAAVVGYSPERNVFLEGKWFEAAVTESFGDFLAVFGADAVEEERFYKRGGALRSEFVRANEAAYRVRQDDTLREIIDGSTQQKKLEGTLCGIPFVGYADLYNEGKHACYDLKYVRDFRRKRDPVSGESVPWFYAYHYDWQAAIYYALTGYDQHLIAATKESVPDVGFWQFENDLLEQVMRDEVIPLAEEFRQVLNGERKARRCEKCEYCRKTKKIKYPELIGVNEYGIV